MNNFAEKYIDKLIEETTRAMWGDSPERTINPDGITAAHAALLECSPAPRCTESIYVDDIGAFDGKTFNIQRGPIRVTVLALEVFKKLQRGSRLPGTRFMTHFMGVPVDSVSKLSDDDIRCIRHELDMVSGGGIHHAGGLRENVIPVPREQHNPKDKRAHFKPKTQKYTAQGERRNW